MFGSQALDTAVGLVFLLFVLATAASSLLELGNRLVSKRARDLESAIGSLLSGDKPGNPQFATALGQFMQTSVYAAASTSSGRSGPAYLSAKSFADAALELTARTGPDTPPVPDLLRERIATLLDEASEDVLELRAGLERWFDEAMGRVSDAYKKQATYLLGVIGFALAVATNASLPAVAGRLWAGPVTRESVVAAASTVGQPGAPGVLDQVATTVQAIPALAIPVGWGMGVDAGDAGWWSAHLLGWLLTAVLVMVGAPYWFELLGRLVSFRSGGQPPRADQDPAAATSRVLARESAAGSAAGGRQSVLPGAAPESELLRRVKAAVQAPGA